MLIFKRALFLLPTIYLLYISQYYFAIVYTFICLIILIYIDYEDLQEDD
jgi:hypothetical protein